MLIVKAAEKLRWQARRLPRIPRTGVWRLPQSPATLHKLHRMSWALAELADELHSQAAENPRYRWRLERLSRDLRNEQTPLLHVISRMTWGS